MRSTRAPLAFLPEIRWLSHRCKSRSGASPPACRSPRRSSPQGSRCETPRCSSIRKQLNARRPKSSKGSASVTSGGMIEIGKVRHCPLLRLPQRPPLAAINHAPVEACESSRSAAGRDCLSVALNSPLELPHVSKLFTAFEKFKDLIFV